jgi:predicted small secreted protein
MKARLWLTLVAVALSVAACNTVEGVGRDISGASNAVRGWFSH